MKRGGPGSRPVFWDANLGSNYTHYNILVPPSPTVVDDEGIDPLTGRPPFTLVERILLTLISWATTIAVRLIGPTMRFAVSCEPNSPVSLEQRPFVYSFWHQCTFAATYLWRDLDIRVMSSHQLRRRVHRPHDPPLRLRPRARLLEPRRCARPARHAQGDRRRIHRRLHHRRPARPALRHQARPRAARAFFASTHGRLSHRHRPLPGRSTPGTAS